MTYTAAPMTGKATPLAPEDLRDAPDARQRAASRNYKTSAEHPGPQELACLECVLPDCDPADARCRNPVARATRLHESQSAGRARQRRASDRAAFVPEVFRRGVGGGR